MGVNSCHVVNFVFTPISKSQNLQHDISMELDNYIFKLPDICHGKQFWEFAGSGLIKRLLKMDKIN